MLTCYGTYMSTPGEAPAEAKSKEEPQKAQYESTKRQLSDYLTDYLKNLNPLDKSWEWYLGAGVSTAASFLAVHTGGASLLAKSLAVSAASIGFHFVDKGIYALKERSIKKNASGSELAQKMAELNDKHAKGVKRIANFFAGVSAGSLYGGAGGLLLQSPEINKVFPIRIKATDAMQKVTETAKSTVPIVTEHAQQASPVVQEQLGNLQQATSEQVHQAQAGITVATQRSQEYVQTQQQAMQARIEGVQHDAQSIRQTAKTITQATQQTSEVLDRVRSEIEQNDPQALAKDAQKVQQTLDEAHKNMTPDQKNLANNAMMLTPWGRALRFLGFKI